MSGNVGRSPGSEPEDESEGGHPDDRPSPRSITRQPATLSSTLSLVTAALVIALGAAFSPLAVAPGVLGLVALGLATTDGSRRMADLGGAALVLTTVLAGLWGPAAVALGCAVGTVLAWDLAGNAIGIGEQIGREADTGWMEPVHAAGTLGAGLLTAGTSYVIYRSAAGGQPVAAVFFLLLAALALISSLRL